MDLSAISLTLLLASLMVASTPILLAAIGELVAEKAEGESAIDRFSLCPQDGGGRAAAAAAGAAQPWEAQLSRCIFAVLTQYFLSNQVATGLALTLFGLGLSAMLGQGYIGIKPPASAKLDLPLISDIPVLGPILFSHDFTVYAAIALVAGVWWFLKYTRGGLILRAVGESHDAAHALGYKVVRVRILAIMFGGACAGLGGAALSLVRVPQWTEGMTAGSGWIALAIVVFASWKPARVLLGAYLFGGVAVLQLNLQAAGVSIPVEYLSMSPYLITIIVLVVMSTNRAKSALNAPAALGRVFHASR